MSIGLQLTREQWTDEQRASGRGTAAGADEQWRGPAAGAYEQWALRRDEERASGRGTTAGTLCSSLARESRCGRRTEGTERRCGRGDRRDFYFYTSGICG